MINKYLQTYTLFLIISFLFPTLFANAQNWVEKMDDPAVNFKQVQQDFNAFWKDKSIGKGKGWKAFKRWEWFMEPRVYPSGDRTEMMQAFSTYHQQNTNRQQKMNGSVGDWSLIGPSVVPSNSGGAGRLNFITFHPSDSNTFYVGAPAGGLWYTNNGGTTWNTATDNLEVIGVSDLLINPEKPNVMYMATGDGDGGATYSIGVLKSMDGGITWNSTGLVWSVSSGYKINKLLMSPSDTSYIYAATNGGIYRSTNAGDNWSQVQSGSFKDIEFNPNDPTIMYACGSGFYKSTDSGFRFTQITSGLPSSSVINRMAIAVTEANSNYVYLIAAAGSSGDYGFYGFYRSTDKGSTFTSQATAPNLLGWESSGSDVGGQGWYDLSIVASPTNANEVYTGGVNIWRTTDGGTNWVINSHWYGQNGNPYVHADIHNLQYTPHNQSALFACCDGGLFKSTDDGISWDDMSNGLAIRQCYRIGLSATNRDLFLTGNQDNGTDAYQSGTWKRVLGGDGMECIIDYNDENYMYAEYYYGSIERSINGGISFSSITNSITETGAWVTPFIMDPVDPTTLYAGYNNVWKTSNRGITWTAISNFGSSSTLNALAVAASNTNYIYAATYSKIYQTANGGSSWTDISSGLPVSSASITYIAVDPADADHVYVTFSGYASGKKVYETTNGGSSWSNISGTLPNLPVNCIVYEAGSNNALYIGTDVGVYYLDNSLSDWASFANKLPSVIVNELEIHYTSGTIKAATYGRGTWESPLYSAQSMAPSPDFNSSTTEVCPGATVQFTDMSSYTPTSWSWTFHGGTPSTSTSQHPSVSYSTEGIYDVTLVATNANGNNTETKTAYIIVGAQELPYVEDLNASAFPPDGWQVVNDDNDVSWAQETVVSADGSTSNCAFMNFYNYSSAGATDHFVSPAIDLSQFTDSVYLTFNVAYCQYSSGYSDGLAVYISTDCGTTYNTTALYNKSGSSLQTTTASSTEYYPSNANQWRAETIDVSSYAGQFIVLKFESTNDYGNNLFVDDINIIASGTAITSIDKTFNEEQQLFLYPNPAKGILNVKWQHPQDETINYRLTDINGKVIYSEQGYSHSGLYKTNIPLNNFSSGVYFFNMKTGNEVFNQKIIIIE